MARTQETGGLGLGARFALSMTVALTVVMMLAGFLLHRSANVLGDQARERAIVGMVNFATTTPDYDQETMGWEVPDSGGVRAVRIAFEGGSTGVRYERGEGDQVRFWHVPDPTESLGGQLARMIGIIVLFVVIVGAGVSLMVAGQIVRPLRRVIDDVRQIARGNLGHRTRVTGGGEIALLARAVDRMSSDLEAAQEAELELSMRAREMELAAGVREALMPFDTPPMPGFDLRAAHLPSGELLGDFYLFNQFDDGRVALVVCDVSGVGIPAALIGATARAYLASELALGGDLVESFQRVNRQLESDVRRGMYVTGMCIVVDPKTGKGQAVCAGHKVPLLIYSAEAGSLRKLHPGGIALGFDRGPVFDRSLEVVDFELAPGDRVVLSSVGPILVGNPDGDELGEPAWFKAVARSAAQPTNIFLRSLKKTIEDFTDGEPYVKDVSIMTIQRNA